jgi:uncharacterized membrane protein YeaQ/YmgE (transglycosylase-associated protein family)
MSSKGIIMTFMTIGSFIGGYIPSLWNASLFSFWGIFTSAAGGILGIWLGYKISKGR